MKINIISDHKGFEKIEERWKYIFSRCGTNTIFISWEWCSTWWKHFGHNNKLLILTVEDADEIVGIAPLMLYKGGFSTLWSPAVHFLGGNITDYMDFLVLRDNREVTRHILDFLTGFNGWQQIFFKRIPESSPNLPFMKEYAEESGIPHTIRTAALNPYVKIEAEWDDYCKTIKRGLKWLKINYALKKFKLLEETSFESRNDEVSRSSLDDFFMLYQKRHAHKLGRSIFEDQTYRDFFYDIAAVLSKLGWLDFSICRSGSKTVSSVFAFKYDGTFSYWIPVFDTDLIKFFPGKAHLHHLLSKCFKEELVEFDFMRGDEEYKFKWSNNRFRKSYEIYFYKNRLFCKADLLRSRTREFIKSRYNRSPFLRKMLIRASKLKFG